jgi:hypothetical protein
MKHIIEGFIPLSGKNDTTSAIREVIKYYGVNLSEEMLLGLGAGLHFYYFSFRNLPHPFIGGRMLPRKFEENLAQHSHINIHIKTTTGEQSAWNSIKSQLILNHPIIVYVEMSALEYLHMPEDQRFGSHCVTVFGFDEEENVVYVSDRDQVGYPITVSSLEHPQNHHIVPIPELSKARVSKMEPFPPDNTWLEIEWNFYHFLTRYQIFTAIRENMIQFLNAPNTNEGLRAILLFARSMDKWKNWSAEKLNHAALNAFMMIDQIGGTGGGAFRKMYGLFLLEAAHQAAAPALGAIGEQYLFLGEQWDEVGHLFFNLYQGEQPDILQDIKIKLNQIAVVEKGLANQLLSVIGAISD